MAHGSSAMRSVPADIAEQFGLVRLSEHEEELVLHSLDLTP
jgi:hypothetical protein